MPSLDLFLNRGDPLGERLTLDERLILWEACEKRGIEHREELIASENTHDVITGRHMELAQSWIALTSGTPAELVVDTACLMFLGTEDRKASELHDALSEFDIRSAACHVGGDGDAVLLSGLPDDLRFTRILFRIQDFVFYAFFGEHLGEELGFCD